MTICNHHIELFGRIFERKETKCCGILTQHKRKVKGHKIISLNMAIELKQKDCKVIPGKMLCRQCVEQYDIIMNTNKIVDNYLERKTNM